jgi:protein phosphatase
MFQPEDPKRLESKGSLFLVADGMGGHQAGEIASRRAVDQVIRTYVDAPSTDVQMSLQRAIKSANASLHAEAQRRVGSVGWGTTMVAAVVRHDELWVANVGDSRAYLLRSGKLRQLTQDHSWVAEAGGDEVVEGWVGRHVITRALGRKPEVEPDLFPPLRLRAGDRILMCSDGLTTPVSDAEIAKIAARSAPQQACEALVSAANEKGGPDNISVILIRVAEYKMDWFRLETWQGLLEGLLQGLTGGDERLNLVVLIAIAAMLLLAVIGLGFVLGLILF